MAKKVIKDIIYCTVDDVFEGLVPLSMTIGNAKLWNMEAEESLTILKEEGMIKDNNIIVPKGLSFDGCVEFSGATEYSFDNCNIKIDLTLDYENEYIK
jgi:hypothetical protein